MCLRRLVILFFTLHCCSAFSDVTSNHQSTTNTLTALKMAWHAGITNYISDGKVFHSKRVEILKSLLNNVSTNLLEDAFQSICETNIAYKPIDPRHLEESFDASLLEAMVDRLVDTKDAQKLGILLKHNCPRYIELIPLEYRLATKWPDGIIVLCDCYFQSKSAQTKHDIYLCLFHAFSTLRNRDDTDDIFVSKVKQWYQQEHSKLIVNEQYPWLPSRPAMSVSTGQDLFISK